MLSSGGGDFHPLPSKKPKLHNGVSEICVNYIASVNANKGAEYCYSASVDLTQFGRPNMEFMIWQSRAAPIPPPNPSLPPKAFS